MRIVLYIFIISIGYLMGSRNLFPKKLENKLSVLQNSCLLFLLGVMGYKIGSNKEIVKNFHEIGIKSLIISSFCIFFSILFVKILCGGIKETKNNAVKEEIL